MNSKDVETFVHYLNTRRDILRGDPEASLALLKEAGIVSTNGFIVRHHRILELTGSLNDKAHKLNISKNFTVKKRKSRCIPHGRD